MALNIQSGQTWAEIRAEINDKAFDKNGDTLIGSVYDSNGEEALKIDVNNQKIYSYGVNGESYYGEILETSGGDIVIPIPKGMTRGLCTIKTATRISTSSGNSLSAIMIFNTNAEQSRIVGTRYAYGFGKYELEEHNSQRANAYIDGEELKIHIGAEGCSKGTINIYWEVW